MLVVNEMAQGYVHTGVKKTKQNAITLLILGIMAGFFITIAGIGAAAASVEVGAAAKLINACIFPAGLVMAVIAGSELFTGNVLLIMPVLEKKINVSSMLRSWILVYIGNLIGSLTIVILSTYGHVYALFDYGLANSIIETATVKANLTFGEAFIKGILCNILVCIAVWMSMFSKTATGKIVCLFFPIMIFVICGFEHCVANMGFISGGLFIKNTYGMDAPTLTWFKFVFHNLVPVTLGNIVGGLMVGVSYWYVYLKEGYIFKQEI